MKSLIIIAVVAFCVAPIVQAQEYEVEWSYQVSGVAPNSYPGVSAKDDEISSDFDGDGASDIVLTVGFDRDSRIWIMISGASHEELFRISSDGWRGPTNLDNDPEAELITVERDNFAVRSGLNGEIEWESGNINGFNSVKSFGDFDNDGRTEFIVETLVDSVFTIQIYGFPGRGDGIIGDNPPLPSHSKLTSGPNPFNGNTNIRYTALNQSVGDITLTDINGREIAFKRDYRLQAGENIIPLSSLTPFYGALPAGSYFVRVVSGDRSETINVTKLP